MSTPHLNKEEQRHVAEQLTEEELAVFDLLAKTPTELTANEREQVKNVARDLIRTLKDEKLVLDWRKRQQTRAAVRQGIGLVLDQLPDKYDKLVYEQKCEELYNHVYEAYFDDGRSKYTMAS
jgi:type I restriction enzyme R subunit